MRGWISDTFRWMTEIRNKSGYGMTPFIMKSKNRWNWTDDDRSQNSVWLGAGRKIQGNFWRDRIVLNLWFSMLSPINPDSFRSYRLQPSRPPCLWDSPGKNTGVVCHFLLQGIFPTQESNQWFLCLLHWQAGSLPVLPLGKPLKIWMEWR